MPFISKTRLAKLESDAAAGRETKKLEKQYKRRIETINENHAEEIEDLERAHSRSEGVLERKVQHLTDDLKNAQSDCKEESDRELSFITDEHERQVIKLESEIDDLENQVKDLKERSNTAAELNARELDLNARDKETERAANLVAEQRKQLEEDRKALDKRTADKNDAFFKQGYTDGVSDTLRSRDEEVDKAHANVFELAKTALNKETTVVTPVFAPATATQKQGK